MTGCYLYFMRATLALLLPALIPSWAFFRAVDPSPRVEWRVLPTAEVDDQVWQEARPRPAQVTGAHMLRRLFWNPRWNDGLYLVSLAERLSEAPTAHSLAEIHRLLADDIFADKGTLSAGYLQFRLVFTHREDNTLLRQVTYVSDPHPLSDSPA